MMIVQKSALAHQGAYRSIGNTNCRMAPSVNVFYTAQEGFPKMHSPRKLRAVMEFPLVSVVSSKADSDWLGALSTKTRLENLCSVIVLTKTFNELRNLWKWFNSNDPKTFLFKYLFN